MVAHHGYRRSRKRVAEVQLCQLSQYDGAMARRPPRSALLAAVGARVRALRESQGLTQRVLAEKSGVSSRFLAQLEAGDGNISLERFDAVARALSTSPAAMLDPRATITGDDERGKQRAAVTELLDRRSSSEL